MGRLPYLVRSRFGLKGIWTPPITYFLGPGIDEGDGSPNTRFLKRMEITRELIAKLPKIFVGMHSMPCGHQRHDRVSGTAL